jgi:glycerol uptake facilitator-like aquaporin
VRKLITVASLELFGTALLACTVVGSGVMGTSLSSDLGVALLINAFSTILVLSLLILVLGPLSGAHLNPLVTLTQVLSKHLKLSSFAVIAASQLLGAALGAILANAMFNLPAIQVSEHARVSVGTLIGEVIATAGLLTVIGVLSQRGLGKWIPVSVAAWIGSAYFFTSSTSFANPAVTFGRVFTNTFAGIAPSSVLPFIAAQVIGMLLGLAVVRLLANAQLTIESTEKV